jgi:6-pyruvoyl-tetrahydropterin synthase
MITQWAQHFICAAHRSPLGVMHGHTWTVRATWSEIINVEDRKAFLVEVCDDYCHRVLDGKTASAEGLAESIATATNAIRVDVWREAEGMGATWRRA